MSDLLCRLAVWFCNCCSSLLFTAKASECCSEFWRWQKPAARGGFPASWPAGVSTELRGRCYIWQLPNTAPTLDDRVGKLCEEHCSKVCTNFSAATHMKVCFGNLLCRWRFVNTVSSFFINLEKAFGSLQSLKLGWLPSMLPVTSTAILPRLYQTQVGKQTDYKLLDVVVKFCFLFLYKSSTVFISEYWLLNFYYIFVYVLESAPKVTPRIPSASLSQHVTVDETVLPAVSQNITAYAANTETSQRYKHTFTDSQLKFTILVILLFTAESLFDMLLSLFIRMEDCEISRVTTVGETPEKRPNQKISQPGQSTPTAQKTATQFVVADTMSSSFNIVENTYSQSRKLESRLTGSCMNVLMMYWFYLPQIPVKSWVLT